MARNQNLPATFAVGWTIERTTNDEGQHLVALTFKPYKGDAARVLMHWGEAAMFSAALSEDVRQNDPHRESRERYTDPDKL